MTFNSVTKGSDGVVKISYNHGSAGERVMHDDDGYASSIALLSILKSKYLAANSPKAEVTVEGWKAEGFREGFMRSLQKLLTFYEENGVCSADKSKQLLCEELVVLYLKIKKKQGDVNYGQVFEISNILRKIDSSDLHHQYKVDYVKEGKTETGKSPTYMLSTDNLDNWLPAMEITSRCGDAFLKKESFVNSLNLAMRTKGVSVGNDGSKKKPLGRGIK